MNPKIKKITFLVCFLSIACFTMGQDIDALDIKNGFREFTFGDSITKFNNMIPLTYSNDSLDVIYRKSNDKLMLGSASISINYTFYNHRLMQISIASKGDVESQILLHELEVMYGKGDSDPKSSEQKFTWKGEKIDIIYYKDFETYYESAIIFSRSIMAERKNDKTKKKPIIIPTEIKEELEITETPKITEVETEDKIVKLGKVDRFYIYLHKHNNYTQGDSFCYLHFTDNEFYNSNVGLDKDDLDVLLKTIKALIGKITEEKKHDTVISIEGNDNIRANASYKQSTGKWDADLYVGSGYFYKVTLANLSELIPLIESARTIMQPYTNKY